MTDWSPIEGKTWALFRSSSRMLDYSETALLLIGDVFFLQPAVFPLPVWPAQLKGGLRDTSCWSQHFLFRKPSRLLQIRHSSVPILRFNLMSLGTLNELEAFLCWHQAPLPARPPLLRTPLASPPGSHTVTWDAHSCLQDAVSAERPCAESPFQEVGIPPPRPPARRPAPSLCSPHPCPALLYGPLSCPLIQFQVQFCSQGRGDPGRLYISGFHPAHPQGPHPLASQPLHASALAGPPHSAKTLGVHVPEVKSSSGQGCHSE